MKIKQDEALDTLEGERLEAYQESEDGLSLKQCKICRATSKGLYLKKKNTSFGRLYKNSKTIEGQAKYKKWVEEVEKLELEVIRWDLVIEKRKEDEERKERTSKEAQEKL